MRHTALVFLLGMVLMLSACTHPPSMGKVKSALQEEIQNRPFEVVEVGCLTGGYLPVKVRFTDQPVEVASTGLYKVYPDGFGHWRAEPGSSKPLKQALGS